MRKILMLAAALVACSKAEKPATDTAAVASAPAMAPAPAPAPLTATYNADSVVISSNAPYASPDPKVPKMNFRAVGRMKDGKMVGTSINTLGSKPDSVIGRGRWEATKAP